MHVHVSEGTLPGLRGALLDAHAPVVRDPVSRNLDCPEGTRPWLKSDSESGRYSVCAHEELDPSVGIFLNSLAA